jgi:hypothetical protein
VSKALAKSIKITAQHCLESKARTFKVAETYPQPEQKPDYISERIL